MTPNKKKIAVHVYACYHNLISAEILHIILCVTWAINSVKFHDNLND